MVNTNADVNKLPVEIKTEWVKRLRDGRSQITGELERMPVLGSSNHDTGQCCLGVLCEIAAEQGAIERREAPNGAVYYNNEPGELPHAVVRWLGWDETNTAATVIHPNQPGVITNLAKLNDAGNAFKVIADIIEKQL